MANGTSTFTGIRSAQSLARNASEVLELLVRRGTAVPGAGQVVEVEQRTADRAGEALLEPQMKGGTPTSLRIGRLRQRAAQPPSQLLRILLERDELRHRHVGRQRYLNRAGDTLPLPLGQQQLDVQRPPPRLVGSSS